MYSCIQMIYKMLKYVHEKDFAAKKGSSSGIFEIILVYV